MEHYYLVILKVVFGIMPLDHVATHHLTGHAVWRELINEGRPEETRSLSIVVPGRRFRLSLQNYRNRGGITNAAFGNWLRDNNLSQPDTKLLFEVKVDDAHNVEYTLIGKVIESN